MTTKPLAAPMLFPLLDWDESDKEIRKVIILEAAPPLGRSSLVMDVACPVLPGSSKVGVWCRVCEINHAAKSGVRLGGGPQPVPFGPCRVAD